MSERESSEPIPLVQSSPGPGRLVPRGPSMVAATSAPKLNTNTLALDLVKALSRRWIQAAVLGVLAALAVGAAVWMLLPEPKPSATARLHIPITPRTGVYDHPDPPLNPQTQITYVKSPLVISRALNRAEVRGLSFLEELKANGHEPEEWLAQHLVADFRDGPEIFRISLTLDDPQQAKVLVNAIKESYLTEVQGRSTAARIERRDRLEKMLNNTWDTLTRQRESIAQDAQNLGGTDAESYHIKHKLAAEQLSQTQGELISIQSNLRRLRNEETAYTNSLKGGEIVLPDAVLESHVDNDPAVVASLQRQMQLQETLEKIRQAAVNPDQNSHYLKLKGELDELKKEYGKLRADTKARIQDQVKKTSTSEAKYHLDTIKQQINLYDALEKTLKADVERLGKVVSGLQKDNLDIEPKRLELRIAEQHYVRVKQAKQALDLEIDAEARVKSFGPVTVSTVEAERRKQFFTGIGAMAALAGVLAIVGFREVRQRRIESPDSVAEGLGLPVVGMIPRQTARIYRASAGAVDNDWQSGLIESINCTRTLLLHGEGLGSLKVVQITSPVSGEGKTTLSTHLALSVALAGRRTLLVDGDLRNPNAHRPFNLPDSPGLCELLRGEVMVEDVLLPSPIAGLTVLPGGRWMDGTQQALASTGLEGIFARLRDEFDFIVVDSSPVLPLTDPLLLARHVDGVIVSLLQGVSRMPLVEEANQRLSVLGVRVLGAVLNGTAHRKYGYGTSYVAPATA